MNSKGVLFILTASILILSCKAKKTTTSQNDFRERTTSELSDAVEKHNVDYEWFSAKAKINFKSSYESGRVSATVRIKKDSLIWMNFKKFGLSLARVQITPDSIYEMYPFENYYNMGDIQEYTELYGMDLEFEKIQSFLVGNVLLPEDENTRSRRIGNEYEIISSYEDYTVKYMIDAVSLILNEHSIIDQLGREVLIDYTDYRRADKERYYSYERTYIAPIDVTEDASAEISISDVEFNVPKSTPYNIPSHYTTFDD